MQSYLYSDRGRLALRGPDRARFLHGMVTADIEKLGEGAGTRAAMLSVKGRLLAELTVYALPDELLLSMDGVLFDKVRVLLDKHIVMDDVEPVDRSAELTELGLYGEDAATRLGAVGDLLPYHHKLVGELHVARDPALGGVGYRVLGPAAAVAAIAQGAARMSDEEREIHRIEAGTARYGLDLDEERLVVEANLDDAISFDKGCYLGQEVVVRATSRGRVNRKLVGLVLDREAPRGAKLSSTAQPDAGMLTSTARSERYGAIALGYVHRAAMEAGAPLEVDGGGRAVVVALPFSDGPVDSARRTLSAPA